MFVLTFLCGCGLSTANYGKACSSALDCTDASAPICLIYFTDSSPLANTGSYSDPKPNPAASVQKGYCVQCKQDCDCDVNQYCGIGTLTFPSDAFIQSPGNGGNANEAARKKELKTSELYALSYSGLPMKSKCMNYNVPSSTCARVIESSDVSIVTESVQSSTSWTDRAVARVATSFSKKTEGMT